MNVASGKDFQVAGTSVLSADGAVKVQASVAGGGLAHSAGVLSVDMNELTAADVDAAADSIMIIDATDDGSKKESIADLATAMAGDGLSASSGAFAVNVDDSSIETNSDTLRVKALGVTNAMLAGDIANAKLSNSTISGKALGTNLDALSVDDSSIEYSSGSAFNGSAASTIRVKALGIATSMLAADAVTGAKIADESIDSEHFVDGSIDTDHLADDAVTAAKLDDTGVSAASYGGSLKRLTATVDAQGRLTAMGEATIQDGSGSAKGVLQVGSGIQVSSGTISIEPMQKHFMLPENNGGPSDENLPSGTIRTGAPSSGAITLTFPIGSNANYVESSLQVYLNGQLLREDAGSDACDYTAEAPSAVGTDGNMDITLRADSGNAVMIDSDDVVTVFLIKA